MKRSFSLLELIFVVAIVTIIASTAIGKFSSSLSKATILKLKGDITHIRDGLNNYKNQNILLNSQDSLDDLDSDGILFKKLLSYPIVSSNTKGGWEKISSSSYKAWVSKEDFVLFNYDSTNFTFDCDIKDDLCKELTQ